MIRFFTSIRFLLFIAFVLTFRSGAANAQYWSPANTGLTEKIGSLAIDGNGIIFAGAVSKFGSNDGVYRSTDGGNSWTATPQSPSEFPLGPVYGVDSKGQIFVGGSYEYRSSDEGNSWTEIRMAPLVGTDPYINAFTIGTPGYMFVASSGSELWVTNNYGNTWTEQGVFQDFTSFPTYVASSPSGTLFAGTQSFMARAKTSIGESWDSIGGAPALGSNVAFGFFTDGTIVAGGTGGLYFSKNNGNYWAPITPSWAVHDTTHNYYYALAISQDGGIFIGTNLSSGRTGGISVSKDTGRSWQDIHSGLTADTITALAFDNDGTLYAGTYNGVFKYNPSGSGVKSDGSDPLTLLTLEQNTPNPVATTTSIRFSLPESGPVSLSVFDVTGRQMAIVVSGYRASGTYTTSFNASDLPNGTYYYRLETGGQSATRMFAIEH